MVLAEAYFRSDYELPYQRYVSERSQIVPSRITAVGAKNQRALALSNAVLALLPYADGRTLDIILLSNA
jgi:ribosomal protein S18